MGIRSILSSFNKHSHSMIVIITTRIYYHIYTNNEKFPPKIYSIMLVFYIYKMIMMTLNRNISVYEFVALFYQNTQKFVSSLFVHTHSASSILFISAYVYIYCLDTPFSTTNMYITNDRHTHMYGTPKIARVHAQIHTHTHTPTFTYDTPAHKYNQKFILSFIHLMMIIKFIKIIEAYIHTHTHICTQATIQHFSFINKNFRHL